LETSTDTLTSDQPTFSVHSESYSGPFEVLITLINKKKLDITEISLLQITDEFIAYLKTLPEKQVLPQLSEFVFIATTLLNLKSFSLLNPKSPFDLLDENLIRARDLLFAKLMQYQTYRKISDELKQRLIDKKIIHKISIKPEKSKVKVIFPENFGVQLIFESYLKVILESYDASKAFEVVNRQNISIKRYVLNTAKTIFEHKKVKFTDLLKSKSVTKDQLPSTLLITVNFLSILELYRLNFIGIEQSQNFSPIDLELNPQYQKTDFSSFENQINSATSDKFKEEDYG